MKMNNKGQFSIIAALLVAVILVGTVISTYSAIRYSNTEDQPQVMSSVDETNLALRQLLGFTLGYYGSVLQVTGNTTYAQNITKTYLNSGLKNVANTKPELGVSFNVTSIMLNVEWFGLNSYSSGKLNVTYDLAGLGFYGLKYSPVCKLGVQVLPSVSGVAHLVVLQDEDEPLNTLTKQNFKFYRYLDSETWNLTSPDLIGEVTLGGTYSINVPSGIDSNSYMVQVEDARGIMVAASSFSHYTSSYTWSTTYSFTGNDYVDQLSIVDGLGDKGSHSDFNYQKVIDNAYDVLTEQNTGANAEQFITQISMVDGSADKGTHNVFNNQKAKDNSFDILTEQNTGGQNTFGNSVGTSSYSTVSSDRIYGSTFISPADSEGATILNIIWYGRKDSLGTSNAKAVLVDSSKHIIGISNSVPVTTTAQGRTCTFSSPPTIHANTQYFLMMIFDSSTRFYYQSVSNQGFYDNSNSYNSPNDPTDGATSSNQYNIQATYQKPTNYELDLEEQFTGVDYSQSNELLCVYTGSLGSESLRLEVWTGVMWTPVIYALLPNQWNNVSVTNYLGNPMFTIRFKGDSDTGDLSQNSWQIDCVLLHTWTVNYELDLEEQFTSADYNQASEWLCIKAGALGSESLRVDVRSGSNWINVISVLQPNQWNNVSVSTWLTSSTFTFRLNGGTETADTTQDSWNIDAALLRLDSNYELFSSLSDSTITVEWLQNGTMRRLGQNLNLTTNAKPIPPIPVKAIHVNQTFVNGTNREVPFQVEDWASNYSIPLGLTNNATVFSNKQMLVYLVDKNVTETTVWWNGSDQAVQTNLAYRNTQFNFNAASRTLNNGRLALQWSSTGFNIASTVGGTSSTASLMRINNEYDTTDPEWAYVITDGVVRDIIQGEAEYSNGAGTANDCPNVYSNIIIALPAKTTYFTYQLRLMFLNSPQDRTISDLCPIKLTSSFNTVETENGVSNGIPIVATGSGTYYNSGYPSTPGTAHHWSQCVTGSSGTGIMFTDSTNQLLYAYDSFVGSATGAIKATSSSTDTIEFLPVTLSPANHYNSALDITWRGAVATFGSGSTPIYNENGGNPTGLWILAEYQPTIAIAAGT
jgi:hypothetical protein